MNIPKLAADNHQFMLIIFLLLTVLGFYAFFTMPRTEDPPLTLPGATVVVILPGANAGDLEELVADPIEEALNELEDIKTIETTIKDGIVSVSIEFVFQTDPQDKYGEVVQQVNSLKSELPDEIYSISFNKWSSTDVNIMQVAFVSDSAEYSVLEDRADDLKKEIERIKGVKAVDLYGLPEQQVRISLDIPKMVMMNISPDQAASAIVSNNLNIPGGRIRSGDISFTVKSSGFYTSLAEIENTVVGSYQGKLVFLKDIASVDFDYADATYIARYNGHKAVFLTVKQKENINIFTIAGDLKAAVEKAGKSADHGVQILSVFDQSDSVKERISGFLSNLWQGMILVGLIIFLSLGFRASIMVIMAVPLSIIIGLGFVYFSGFGLQQITIASLVMALGMLVDNSIIVNENIERFMRQGVPAKIASIDATNQLFWAVIASTLTTQLAFVPIFMMPDETGEFIKSMPLTLIFTLLASLLVALVLTPYLAGKYFRVPKRKQNLPLKKMLDRIIEGPYSAALESALRKPWHVVSICVVMVLLSLLLIKVTGISFFPKAEKNQLVVRITVPEQSDIHYTEAAAKRIEGILDKMDLVKHYATNIGYGNPRIYYNLPVRQAQKNFAEIFVELEYFKAKEFDALVSELRDTFSRITYARAEVKELEQGSPIEAPLVIKLTGENSGTLLSVSRQIVGQLEKIPGVINIDNQIDKTSTDLRVVINKDKAALLGVPVSDIDRSVRTFIAGTPVSVFHGKEGKVYDIVLRAEKGDSVGVEDLQSLYIRSLEGRFIPLSQLAAISFEPSSGIITHYNMSRSATITADLDKGYFIDNVISQISPWLGAYPWPSGYGYHFGGEVESRQESFGGMFKALIIASFLIFALLVVQFRSLTQPLIIFSAVPLAVTGGIVALFVTGYPFSFTAFIGAIGLVGIVVNNSIILVDYTNKLIAEGKSVAEAIRESGKTRLTPIFLTATTTIGGLLPLALLGGTLWAPMSWTIIGGLFFSTALTLIVVPVLYMLFEGKKANSSTF